MSGLFATFNIVKRGMMAHQTALNVTAHNVANADTDGYSVQRANLKTSQPFGMPSLSSAGSVGQLGTGVLVDSITRARDVYLDGQIRKEQSTISNYSAREDLLSEIETIFMEPSDTGLSTNLSNFWDAWNQLSSSTETSTSKTLVVENGDSLATSIRHTYEQLSDMEVNAGDKIKIEIFETNDILKQISDLNEQIKTVEVSGLEPNDLLDSRDNLLDKLSEKFSFSTTQTNFEGIVITPKIEGVTSGSIVEDGDVNYNLSYVADEYSVSGNVTDGYKLNLKVYAEGDSDRPVNVQLDFVADKDLINTIANVTTDIDGNITGISSLKTHSIFTTGYNGTAVPPTITIKQGVEFKDGNLNGYEAIRTDIKDYKSRLNKLARALTVTVNTIHSNLSGTTGTVTAENNMNFFVTDSENDAYSKHPTSNVSIVSALENDDEPAKNIQINKRFVDDVAAIDAGKVGSGAGNGERATLIGSLRNLRVNIQGITRETFLEDNFGTTSTITSSTDLTQITTTTADEGFTMDNYFVDAITKLGVDSEQAETTVINQHALLAQLKTRREAISGVSLDEEITNMIQFQRSYEANARLISVIDELLNVVVNGLIK